MRFGSSRLYWLLIALWLFPAAAYSQRLLDFYEQALESNPALQIRALGIEQAKAQEEIAAARLLPQISATGNYYWNDFRESGLEARRYDGVRAGLQARQALFDLVSYFRLKGARFFVSQSEYERGAAQLNLGGEVVDRYLNILHADDQIRHLQVEKETTEKQMQRLRFMRDRQLVRMTDVLEVEAYYQTLVTREVEASATRAVAVERLRETTGLTAKQLPTLARDTFPSVPGAEVHWVGMAARDNPNLVALLHAIDAARNLIESSRSEHFPQVALTATHYYSDQGFDNRQVPPYHVGTLGVQITIPLYEGGRVQASIRDAAARYEIARARYDAARREIERGARTAYLGAIASYARIGSTNEEVRALEKVLDSQQRSYSLGVTTIVDVLTAQQRLFKARTNQLEARYDYIRALTFLRVHAGTLEKKDLEEIDSWMALNEG